VSSVEDRIQQTMNQLRALVDEREQSLRSTLLNARTDKLERIAAQITDLSAAHGTIAQALVEVGGRHPVWLWRY
jgi:hypothetical protein